MRLSLGDVMNPPLYTMPISNGMPAIPSTPAARPAVYKLVNLPELAMKVLNYLDSMTSEMFRSSTLTSF